MKIKNSQRRPNHFNGTVEEVRSSPVVGTSSSMFTRVVKFGLTTCFGAWHYLERCVGSFRGWPTVVFAAIICDGLRFRSAGIWQKNPQGTFDLYVTERLAPGGKDSLGGEIAKFINEEIWPKAAEIYLLQETVGMIASAISQAGLASLSCATTFIGTVAIIFKGELAAAPKFCRAQLEALSTSADSVYAAFAQEQSSYLAQMWPVLEMWFPQGVSLTTFLSVGISGTLYIYFRVALVNTIGSHFLIRAFLLLRGNSGERAKKITGTAPVGLFASFMYTIGLVFVLWAPYSFHVLNHEHGGRAKLSAKEILAEWLIPCMLYTLKTNPVAALGIVAGIASKVLLLGMLQVMACADYERILLTRIGLELAAGKKEDVSSPALETSGDFVESAIVGRHPRILDHFSNNKYMRSGRFGLGRRLTYILLYFFLSAATDALFIADLINAIVKG